MPAHGGNGAIERAVPAPERLGRLGGLGAPRHQACKTRPTGNLAGLFSVPAP